MNNILKSSTQMEILHVSMFFLPNEIFNSIDVGSYMRPFLIHFDLYLNAQFMPQCATQR